MLLRKDMIGIMAYLQRKRCAVMAKLGFEAGKIILQLILQSCCAFFKNVDDCISDDILIKVNPPDGVCRRADILF